METALQNAVQEQKQHEEQECGVCCSAFTGAVRRRIVCPYCRFPACMQCVQRQLLSSLAEPRCMAVECRRTWLRDFLDSCLPLTWLRTKFRDHRRSVLLDRERSLLPATAPTAVRVRAFRRDAARVQEALDAYREVLGRLVAQRTLVVDMAVDLAGQEAVRVARINRYLPFDTVYREIDHAAQAVRDMAADTRRLEAYVPFDDRPPGTMLSSAPGTLTSALPDPVAAAAAGESSSSSVVAPAPRQILFSCPADGCRGYIETGTKFTCGLCSTRVCGQCREIRPAPVSMSVTEAGNEDAKEDKGDAHVCHPDTLASVRMLAKDSKACPQCRALIFRTDGCHQMFCTVCHVSFCWRTLEILTGPVHNPHYFEWRRTTGAGAGPGTGANAGGQACPAQNGLLRQQMSTERFLVMHLRHHLRARTALDNFRKAAAARAAAGYGSEADFEAERERVEEVGEDARPVAAVLLGIEQFVNHTRAALAHQYRVQPLDQRNLDLRIQYLLGELDEESWKAKLQRDERAHARHAEFLLIWQAFWLAAEEMQAAAVTDLDAKLQSLDRQHEPWQHAHTRLLHDPVHIAVLDLGTGWYSGASSRFLSLGKDEYRDLGVSARAHAQRLWELIDYTNAAQHRAAVRFACRYQRIAFEPSAQPQRTTVGMDRDSPHIFRLVNVSTAHSEPPLSITSVNYN